MNEGKYVFAQIADFIPRYQFDKLATWAYGKYSKGAVKMHTLLDLRGSIPT